MPVVSLSLFSTSAKVAVDSTPEGGSAAVAYCAYRVAPGLTSQLTATRPVVGL
ncbi:Uncharacterised protein [Bordetella pertussis]|nr:Uncharacterised protein [Bordetella pertussis]